MVARLKQQVIAICVVITVTPWLSFGVKSESCFVFESDVGLSANYVVFDVVRYRGGITTLTTAQQRIGESVFLGGNEFKIGSTSVDCPVYKIVFYQPPPEGELESRRWSGFYGFDTERDKVKILQVYRSGDEEDSLAEFEVVNDELWQMQDGWIYKMKPSKSIDEK